MKFKNKKWNDLAEMIMMGYVCPIDADEDLLTYLVKYILKTICPVVHEEEITDELIDYQSEEVLDHAMNSFNSEDLPIQYFCINTINDMVMFTFVRDINEEGGLISRDGVLSWVENVTYPDLSELGYCFFAKDKSTGRVRRIG